MKDGENEKDHEENVKKEMSRLRYLPMSLLVSYGRKVCEKKPFE
jgi:hypothetical protein